MVIVKDLMNACLLHLCKLMPSAQLLANHLKKLFHKVISIDQSTFIQGRQILDDILMANEIVDLVRIKCDKCFLFKVEFEKHMI